MSGSRTSGREPTERAGGWLLGAGLWAAGLARILAEVLHLLPLFSSLLLVGGVVTAGMGLALVLWWAMPPLRPRLTSAWPVLLLPVLYIAASRPPPLTGLVLLTGAGVLVVLLVAISHGFSAPEPAKGKRGLAPGAPWLLALLGATTFGLYLRTLGRAVGEADTFEFQVVAPALGIAHPTGYPLYILLGKLFSMLPFGSVAWRVNLTSAVAATGAVLCLYVLLERAGAQSMVGTEAHRGVVAFLVALTLAFSRLLWSQAVVAEVYALNLLFVAALLALATVLLEGRGSRRTVGGLAFLAGLALTHHLTILLFLPAVGLALLLARPRIGWRGWIAALGLFLLGLAVIVYIPLRWPALHDGRWMSGGEFLAYVTGRQFGGALQVGLLRDPTRYAILARVLLEPFGWAGIGLAVVGLAWLVVRRPALALVTLLAFLTYCLYGLVYLVPDISVFLLPTHLLLALWMGLGGGALVRWAGRRRGEISALLLALLALLPLSRIWINLGLVDQSRRMEAERWGRYVLSLPLVQDAAVLADGEKFAPLYYLQQVEGLRPDLDLAVHFTEEEYRADLAARLSAGQTVYLARYLPHLEGHFLRSLGPLVEVGTGPMAAPPPEAAPVGVTLGSGVELLAFDLQEDPEGRPLRHLTLYWRAVAPIQDDLEVRLRLVDGEGRTIWTAEGSRPVSGNYPTNAWPADTVIPDYHSVPLPPWLPPGRYRLEAGLFPRFSVEEGGPWVPLTAFPISLPQETEPLSHQVALAFGTVWLTGYDLPEEAGAGAPLVVDLAWEGVGDGVEGSLEWVGLDGEAVGGVTFTLPAGMVRSHHVIDAPADAGGYRLRLRVKGATARCRWLAAASPGCELGKVQVTPIREGLANFDGRLLLVAAEVGAGQVRPGGAVPVVLHWRALRGMGKDYTVTVQLVGPDGRLYGQVDSWPVQGTYPTSEWVPGEEVADPYQVPLAPDAPPGRYRVIAAVYLLETMGRLPVVDMDGNPVADHAVLGEIEVVRP